MNPAKSPSPFQNTLLSQKKIEYENAWYASVFKLFRDSGNFRWNDSRDLVLQTLLERTCDYLRQILRFQNTAFYLTEDVGTRFTLKYWKPVTRESLFRCQVASLIQNESYEGWNDPDRAYVYGKSGSFLVLQAIATPKQGYGVFAGMYDEAFLPASSHEKLNQVSGVLQNLAQVLEVIFHRGGISPVQEEVRLNPPPFFPTQNRKTFFFDWDTSWPQESKGSFQPPFHDFLTELPSRPLVEDRLNMALAHARYGGEKVAVLLLNIDNFKRVNDCMGPSAGDMLLKNLSERIRKSLREQDTLGRLGGDEFILLLPDIHLVQDVEYRVQKILDTLRTPFQIEEREIHASCSVGIAVFPEDAEETSGLLEKARAALSQAKQEGKDRYHFFKPFMRSTGSRRTSWENDLQKALEQEEFQLHFQPKLSIQSGKVEGMEALLRWNHPERGLVYPSEFVPAAEEMGLIQAIGEWVLLNACQQIKAWRRAGFPPISIAVNLSGHQVNQPHWVSRVQAILERTGVDPASLEMEITETVLMDNSDVALSNLHQLDELGIRISIDDFGTGYSSLSYLKRFPIHALKIDRSFVRGIGQWGEGTDAVITRAIVSLAQALNLKTVAEGVEQVREKAYLGSIGCDDIQGFLFSKPLPVERINYMFTRKMKNPVRNYWPPGRVSKTV